jgi:kynurenine formamidase
VGKEPGISPIITPDVIKQDEERNGELREGDVVLFWTAWDEQHFVDRHVSDSYVEEPFRLGTKPGWPAPDVDAAQYLHSKGVRFLATDGTSMGPVHDGAPVHWWALANDMLFLEAGTNFGALPPRGAWFQFLPIKVAGSTGGAGRAMAFVPNEGDA